MLQIGSVPIDMPAVQAALSGYSDLAMRRVARAHGAPFCIHEVVLDRLVVEKGKLQRQILEVPEDDHPVGGQLMGTDPKLFGEAARTMMQAGFDIIDINFGCPVPKVLGRCRGGYLLGDPAHALSIVESVVQSCGGEVPVTVKMRRGIDASPEAEKNFFEILDGAFERGIDGVTVHGRSVVQRYEGPSDWSFLARVKRHLGDKILLGSGDLFTPYDVIRMLEETGVDGVTVARGCIGNPWIFGQVRDLLAGREVSAPTIADQRRAIEMHAGFNREHSGKKAFGKTRTHAIKYCQVHPDAADVRNTMAKTRDFAQFEAVLEQFYGSDRGDEIGRLGIDHTAAMSHGVRGGKTGE